MDFRQFQYICAIAEHKSITKAAAALYMSQPSLSHFVSKTERELGITLFNRSTSPISLTFAGERYVENAKQILKISEDMNKQFRDISRGMTGRLRIGMSNERAAYMLPLILPAYLKEFPGMDVRHVMAGGEELLDAIFKGKIDFMILLNQVPENGLKCSYIYEEELILIAPKGFINERHLIEGHKNAVNLAKLADEEFILMQKDHAIRKCIDAIFRSYEISPLIHTETRSNIFCLRMAAAGLGLAIVPRMTTELAKASDDYDAFYIGIPPATWEVVAAYRSDAYIGVAEQAFLDIARKVFSEKKAYEEIYGIH